jgi:hypothetical protein
VLVEVLRGDNTVLASDTFLPGAWDPGNYNLDAGLKGTFTYVGDYTGDVRIRLSKAGAGIFGASVDNLSLTPNWFNHMPTDGIYHTGDNITELTHWIPDPNDPAETVTTTVVYGTNGTETVPGILDAGGGNSTLVTTGTGSVPYVPALGDHFWQIKVEETGGQPTYYSPVNKFSIVKVGPVAIIGGPLLDSTAYHSWTEQGVMQNIFIYDGGSYDPDSADPLTYAWSTTAPFSFLDPTAKDPNIGISDSCGAWNLTLTVTDSDGLTGTTTAVNGIWFQCEPCNYAIWSHAQDYMWEGQNLNPRYRDHLAADVYDNRAIYAPNISLRGDCRVDEYDLLALAAVWLGDRAKVDNVTPHFNLKDDADFFCGAPVVGVDIDPNTGMFDMSVIADQWGTDMLLVAPDYSKP